MKYTHCIWDFNGTVLDDVSAGIRAVNVLLSARGLPIIESVDKYREVFGFPVKKYYERLGFDFSKESYDVIAHEWVALYLEYVKDCTLCEGVREALSAFREKGTEQVLLSATEQRMLEGQVSFLGLENEFCEVLGLDNIYAVSKLDAARKWRQRNRDAQGFFIGDTVHDRDAAEVMGIDCYLIASGHQPKSVLEKTGVPVFDTLDMLLEYLTQNGLI